MSETEEKTLEDRRKALEESEKKFKAEKLEFLQNKLISLGKDDSEIVRSITNEDSLQKLIAKRNKELEEESKKKAEMKKEVPILNAGNTSGTLPQVPITNSTKRDEMIQKMVANYSAPAFFLPDKMRLNEGENVFVTDAMVSFIPPDREHPYKRVVG